MKRGIKTVLISLLSLLASGNPQGRNSFWIELTSENYDGNGVLLAPRVVENATALATTSNLDSYDYTFSNPSGSIAYSSSTFCGWEQNSISSTYSEYNPSISTTPLSFPVGTPKNQINLVDNRVVVSQTTAFRPGAVVAIDSTFSDGYSYGTGCLISPNVVLTCAHVLYGPSKPNGQKVARVGVSINLHGQSYSAHYYATDVVIPCSYVDQGQDYSNDWALLRFDVSIGSIYGYLSTTTYASIGNSINSSIGYAGDNTQLYCSSSSGVVSDSNGLCELYGFGEEGMSGGPVLQRINNEVTVVGIILAKKTYGSNSAPTGKSILALKLKNSVFQMRRILEDYY
jgi:V8-like Glu-specific endopeptidase